MRYRPISIRREQALEAVDVHGLVQTVADGLAHQRMVGDLAVAGEVLGAGDLVGKDRAIRSSAPMRASCGGTLRPPRKRGSASETPSIQRQRVMNIGASSIAWISSGRDAWRNAGSARPRRAGSCARWSSESTMLSSVAAACSSKLNLRQKRLRSASPQARLMRLPIGRMDDELHAAGFVEEALEHDRLLRRQAGRARRGRGEVLDQLLGGGATTPRSLRQPAQAPSARVAAQTLPPMSARRRDTATRQLVAAAGASPSQNGMVGGMPCASSTRTTPRSTRRMR